MRAEQAADCTALPWTPVARRVASVLLRGEAGVWLGSARVNVAPWSGTALARLDRRRVPWPQWHRCVDRSINIWNRKGSLANVSRGHGVPSGRRDRTHGRANDGNHPNRRLGPLG